MRSQMRKGQISLFMILGIILLGAALLFFQMQKDEVAVDKDAIQSSAIGLPIQQFTQSCIEKSANEAILQNSLKGGYFLLPEETFPDAFGGVPYYVRNGENYVPNDGKIAHEIGLYVDALLEICLEGFNTFADQGYTVESKASTSSVFLSPTQTTLNVNLPLTITQENLQKTVSSFQLELATKEMYDMLSLSRLIVETFDDGLCLSCIADAAEQSNLQVHSFQMGPVTVIQIERIEDESKWKYLIWRFAIEN
jgi:hypothetical protein